MYLMLGPYPRSSATGLESFLGDTHGSVEVWLCSALALASPKGLWHETHSLSASSSQRYEWSLPCWASSPVRGEFSPSFPVKGSLLCRTRSSLLYSHERKSGKWKKVKRRKRPHAVSWGFAIPSREYSVCFSITSCLQHGSSSKYL